MITFDKNFNVLYAPYKQKIPIKLWLGEVESGALDQMINLSNLPFAYHHVAGMPDMHQGYGMPIGGVMASDGYIVPNAVGVDIGCGMIALRTSLFSGSLNKDILKKIMEDIRKLVPLGFKHCKVANPHKMPEMNIYPPNKKISIIEQEWDAATYQLGTLGGGNHFIEIQQGSDGHIWIMIHSGSRNLGNKVATHYNKIAVELNDKWKTSVPKSWQLAFFPFDSDEGKEYFGEMKYCCDFALANRQLMMEKVMEAMSNHVDVEFDTAFKNTNINIHHNYAAMENHFGRNVLVHRKGATRAFDGEYGIIPGSQGTSSYIVMGKGNSESFRSCSHGSGRVLSRTKAKEVLNLKNEIKKLDDQGIVHGIRTKSDLDEASGAYKDITTVMNNQKDLVEIIVDLKPLAVIKG